MGFSNASDDITLPNGKKLTVRGNAFENGQLYYDNKLMFKHEYGLTIDKVFPSNNGAVILVGINSGGNACDPPSVLISINKDGNVLITKEFGECELLKNVVLEGEKIILTYYDGKAKTNKIYTYLNGALRAESAKSIEKIHGRTLTGAEILERFNGEYAFDILGDPDFKATLKSKLKISNRVYDELENVMVVSGESNLTDGSLLIKGGLPHMLDRFWGVIKISENGNISCLASLTTGYIFYTNNQKYENTIDSSLLDGQVVTEKISIKHYCNGNEKYIDYLNNDIKSYDDKNLRTISDSVLPLDLCGDLYTIFGQLSRGNFTELQQEQFFDQKLKNRVVQAKLKLYQVSKDGDVYKLWLDQGNCIAVYAYINNPEQKVIDYLLRIRKGDTITVVGVLTNYGTIMGANFTIRNASIAF